MDNRRKDIFEEICKYHLRDKYKEEGVEVRTIRWLEDNFFTSEDLDNYRKVSDLLVDEINNLKYGNVIYDYLYDEMIEPCVNAINIYDFKYAYIIYRSTLYQLNEELLKPSLEKKLVKVLKNKNNKEIK